MNYTTYYEQSESISEERYGELKGILEAEPKREVFCISLKKTGVSGSRRQKSSSPLLSLCKESG